MMTTGPDPKIIYAYESADRSEALSFKCTAFRMSDSCIPRTSRFHKPNSVRFIR